jgi:hypothetical protein
LLVAFKTKDERPTLWRFLLHFIANQAIVPSLHGGNNINMMTFGMKNRSSRVASRNL